MRLWSSQPTTSYMYMNIVSVSISIQCHDIDILCQLACKQLIHVINLDSLAVPANNYIYRLHATCTAATGPAESGRATPPRGLVLRGAAGGGAALR